MPFEEADTGVVRRVDQGDGVGESAHLDIRLEKTKRLATETFARLVGMELDRYLYRYPEGRFLLKTIEVAKADRLVIVVADEKRPVERVAHRDNGPYLLERDRLDEIDRRRVERIIIIKLQHEGQVRLCQFGESYGSFVTHHAAFKFRRSSFSARPFLRR